MPDTSPTSSGTSGAARWARRCALVSGSAIALNFLIYYLEGRFSGPSPLAALPGTLLAVGGAIGAFVALLQQVVRRQADRTTSLLAVSPVLLWCAQFTVLPDPFLLGLKDRVFHAMTPDELRQLAREAGELGPERFVTHFAARPIVAKLGGDVFVTRYAASGIFIGWGGGFIQWGVRVLPGGVVEKQEDADYTFWSWAPDIGFVTEN
jgi:hypothetical protein